MRLLIAALALLSALLGGCAAVPMASMDADKEAKQFQPRPGMSNIYLYRNETSELGHYALPATDFFQREDVPISFLTNQPEPYLQWTDAVARPVAPCLRSRLCEGRRLGRE